MNQSPLAEPRFLKDEILNANIYVYRDGLLKPKLSKMNLRFQLGKNEVMDNFDELIIDKIKKDVLVLEFPLQKEAAFDQIFVHFLKTNETEKKSAKTKKQSAKIAELEKELKLAQEKAFNLETKNLKLELSQQQQEQNFVRKTEELGQKALAKARQKVALEQSAWEEKMLETKKYGQQKLFEQLLALINNLELAISWGQKSTNQEVLNYLRGFQSLLEQIEQTLAAHQIKKIIPQIGAPYEPHLHEIITNDFDKSTQNYVISDISQAGYQLFDRIIIPAKVKVSAS